MELDTLALDVTEETEVGEGEEEAIGGGESCLVVSKWLCGERRWCASTVSLLLSLSSFILLYSKRKLNSVWKNQR